MAFTKEAAIERARQDLSTRIAVAAGDISETGVDDADFPDMALGAAAEGEMSGQMITPGWRIRLQANGQAYEYRANKNQLRLYDFRGENYKL